MGLCQWQRSQAWLIVHDWDVCNFWGAWAMIKWGAPRNIRSVSASQLRIMRSMLFIAIMPGGQVFAQIPLRLHSCVFMVIKDIFPELRGLLKV